MDGSRSTLIQHLWRLRSDLSRPQQDISVAAQLASRDASLFGSAAEILLHAVGLVAQRLHFLTWQIEMQAWLQKSSAEYDGSPNFNLDTAYGTRREVVELLLRRMERSGVERPAVLELGVYEGELAFHLLRAFPNMSYVGVDAYFNDEFAPGSPQNQLFELVHQHVAKRMEDYQDRAILLKLSSEEALKIVPKGAFDLIFIDADHRYQHVKHDLEHWSEKVRPQGILAGHDFSPEWPGPVQAVFELRKSKPVNLGMSSVFYWYVGVDDD
ncbi:unnamed protein product [Vitrella brassicaformis CCMP3155]|uniref:Class I SAM-dependent methyltransferase n=1 Tax=Vitrella brassicaformis (strain CCMP3155) TaxID=1169540 RepID=A0A0G4G6K1_VITBC|nr:unnamed protein product [Vitrella brassicaformis CCMP3155]|eukprot:CEM24096.1 unnamed protein product [Vitrella brassicaformis CCMP3155]